MSVVWARLLLPKREPRLSGNGDLTDTRKSGVKQGFVLAPTLFAVYFAALLQHALVGNEDGICLRTRFDGSLLNLKRLKSKRLTTEVLFSDAAAIANYSELQRQVDRLAEAYHLFGLTISVKKTEVIGQGTNSPPEINLGDESLKTVKQFVYLGATITSALSLDGEIDKQNRKDHSCTQKTCEKSMRNS